LSKSEASGKALIYLYLYTPCNIGDLHIDHLDRIQRIYESEIGRMKGTTDNGKKLSHQAQGKVPEAT
jgi:hypothetical protein